MLRSSLLVATLMTVGASCYEYDPLFCRTPSDCADNGARSFCDQDGQHEGIANTCIAPPPSSMGHIELAVPTDTVYAQVNRSVTMPITIERKGIDGDVVISVDGLPEGVAAAPLTIPRAAEAGALTLSAAERAPFAVAAVRVEARIDSTAVQRTLQLEVVGTPGTPDTSFSTDGTRYIDMPLNEGAVMAAFAQGDAVVVASSQFGLFRVLPDGTLDRAFGTDGRATFDIATLGLEEPRVHRAIQDAEGRFSLIGEAHQPGNFNARRPIVARFTRDGEIDPALPPFAMSDEDVDVRFSAVAMGQDGKFLVSGTKRLPDESSFEPFIMRFSADWRLDNSFHADRLIMPEADVDVPGLAFPDGSVLLNHKNQVVKLTATGQIDNAFGDDGAITLPSGSGAPVWTFAQPTDGSKTLVVGTDAKAICLWRVRMDGQVDIDFGDGGRRALPRALDGYADAAKVVREDATGALFGIGRVFGPDLWRVKMFRLEKEGDLDRSFGTNGIADDTEWWNITSFAVMGRHRAVAVGFNSAVRGVMIRRFWY